MLYIFITTSLYQCLRKRPVQSVVYFGRSESGGWS